MVEEFLIYLWICFFIISLGYSIVFWVCFKRGSYKVKNVTSTVAYPPVSVIISYKNAGEHIYNTVSSILNQEYPNFEVVAIDDFSSDSCFEKLGTFNDSRLQMFSTSQDIPGKKIAISEAIAHAKYDILLFTDADCIPISNQWIKSMVTALSNHADNAIVLGYGPFYKQSTLVNVFARYENYHTAIQYFSYAIASYPYMGVGRNLMYLKSLFTKVNGFESHMKVTSGDDDLFVQSVANHSNFDINLGQESFVYSHAKLTLKEFLEQKTRHITTSQYYKLYHILLLGLYSLSHVLVYIIPLILIYFGFLTLQALILVLLFRWMVLIVFSYYPMKILHVSDLWKWIPILDILLLFYLLILPVFSLFKKKNW